MNIYAFHHTTKEKADSIFKNGFNEAYFEKVSIGYGVQCFLEKKKCSEYVGKEDGQIKVLFCHCRLLKDESEIRKSTEKIQAATKDQKRIAKEEAERLKSFGYDAYIYGKDIIVFLNYPRPIEWIPFEEPENIKKKSLADEIIELAKE